jgi:hypothetical protein
VLSINMIVNWFAIGLTLKLDAKDDLNPDNIGAALTTAASSVIEIINPASTKPALVKWESLAPSLSARIPSRSVTCYISNQ